MTTSLQTPVRTFQVWEGRSLPALVRAHAPGAPLPEWVAANRDRIDELAHRAGAVLFRQFGVAGPDDFRAVMDALSPQVLAYGERSSPRSKVSDGVYTSTEYPADQPILLHNEQSYTAKWPTRIVFFCERAATSGGRTPLADSRRVLARLRPATVAKFEQLGVRYVRNYLPGISLPWQEAFQTERRADVDAYCAGADITAEWVDDDHLRTAQVRPAVRTHPVTGERTWFNHALFFHVTSLPEEVSTGLREVLDEEDLPYNTYYGDGSRIEDDVLAELRAAYEAETTAFDWQPGDVLLVENMLVAHAREPFEGPRRILTAMSDAVSAGAVVSGAAAGSAA
ncbi:TauD/TfdA family dioxygenase [Streptomyces sp. WAC05374]|uniref:TauD/TfdA family dioxygenase n=1 Tax=Streptomyces sp. WAC05374 TaxID=2487420 RepID=UPI000F883D3A|nr:TauD/TfdA family dioxygenase [Streptomyces sp. WAC05374]RST18333.1 TauD/TfdA family dioxygenase [Streptomyces sp. WAC05374]TDF39104.1 TauD/TfdA family dioxygenase [Streptomyces sp. WAC05374]TDF47473.1 TauD/TfdA family dioxygenase [Streptomyces sp. WAC05374]TDF48212.1 TauD/TfdA family dioxygenase [Streptomyces sp. WAC05374]